MFFLTPLVLVARMSVSSWPLLTGYKGLNFPKNFVAIWNSQLFGPAVVFTLEYTVLVTILLIGSGLAWPFSCRRSADGRRLAHDLPPPRRGRSGVGFAALLGLLLALDRAHQSDPRGGRRHPSADLVPKTSTSSLLSTTFLIVWKFAGLYMLILLVGLQGIPNDVFEASALDGASRGQTFRYITLPLLRPSLALASSCASPDRCWPSIGSYILTKGGPDNTTVTVVQLIYREAFQRQNLGTAAAISVVVMLALLVLNAVQFRLLRDPERN